MTHRQGGSDRRWFTKILMFCVNLVTISSWKGQLSADFMKGNALRMIKWNKKFFWVNFFLTQKNQVVLLGRGPAPRARWSGGRVAAPDATCRACGPPAPRRWLSVPRRGTEKSTKKSKKNLYSDLYRFVCKFVFISYLYFVWKQLSIYVVMVIWSWR